MKTELKTIFKSMPIEISHNEYMILANILYASWQAMASTNEMILIIDLVTKKVYGFDEENLARNKLTLEKVVLERLILKQNAK